MGLRFVNRICPLCKNPNYMVSIFEISKVYKYKCLNCNGYFKDDDFPVQKDGNTNDWEHLWDAPDGSYKGRCRNCGFMHVFIEGHDMQYIFCPSCGERKIEV